MRANYRASLGVIGGRTRFHTLRMIQDINRIAFMSTKTLRSPSPRIHILGVGNLGRLFAHALAKADSTTPITLLLHRASLAEEWEQAGKRIEIITDGVPDRTGSFDVEVVSPDTSLGIIDNLIVATKTIRTASAISAIKHRLTSESTVLLTQNGMGTADELNDVVFKDPSTRPKYLAAITSHGVYSQGPFRSVHAGLADVTIGRLGQSTAPQYLIDKIVQAPILSAREVTPSELLLLQLQKLVINAMMNPMTVIFNCRNGELYNREPILQVMRKLLREASQVIQSLPQLQGDSISKQRFSQQNLERVVLDVAKKTGKNTSSMLQDVRAGRETEIDYINGYIIARGKQAGIDCTNNERLVRMVKEKKIITDNEAIEYFP
jgi:2-dehydropantoate 2-reductase